MKHEERMRKKVRRKLAQMKPCPFCGRQPNVRAYVEPISKSGSAGHGISISCCRILGLGPNELFFTNRHSPRNFKLWKSTVDWVVNDWNRRPLEESS